MEISDSSNNFNLRTKVISCFMQLFYEFLFTEKERNRISAVVFYLKCYMSF